LAAFNQVGKSFINVHVKILPLSQEAEIGHLETEVERLKIEHAETLQQMKSNFLKEKANHEHDADHKIKQVFVTIATNITSLYF
jgi:hypothetical protein